MERRTKHRLLGLLVVIGLVIVLLPLFESKRELTAEATVIKAPPFPDQSAQVADIADEVTPTVEAPTEVAENNNKQQPDDTIKPMTITATATPTISPPTDVAPVTPITPVATSTSITPATSIAVAEKTSSHTASSITTALNAVTKPVTKIKKIVHVATKQTYPKPSRASINLAPLDDNGLIKLKNAVWVIQIGTFKNKTTALRLVNHLRANGYRAFIQQVSNSLGEQTRVFVGPELKQVAARQLVSELESAIHIRGIVIRYQPLTL